MIKVKDCLPPGMCMPRAELAKIAASLTIDCAAVAACMTASAASGNAATGGSVLVHFGSNPPLGTCTPWQKTDDCGTPVGKIKRFTGGKWV